QSTSGSCTPPAQRWSRGFEYLIADQEGLRLFEQFLELEDGSTHKINFYFLVASIRSPDNYKWRLKLVRGIFKKYILTKSSLDALCLSKPVKDRLVAEYKKLQESVSSATKSESSGSDSNNN